MNTWNRRIFWAGAAVVLALLTACEPAAKRENSPGATPQRRDPKVTSKINASTFAAHGELLERRGDLARAVEQYQKALEITPDLVTARNRLGVTLNKLGRHADASAEFRRAIVARPQDAYLYNNLGFSLYLEERYAEAEPVLSRAIELQPAFQRARMNHGLVLARLGEFDEAYEEFVTAGSAADAHYNVAVIQAESGRYVDAARRLELALQEDPAFEAARTQLQEIARLAAAQETQLAAKDTPEPVQPTERVVAVAAAEPELPAVESPAELAAHASPAPAPATQKPRLVSGPATEPPRDNNTPNQTVAAATANPLKPRPHLVIGTRTGGDAWKNGTFGSGMRRAKAAPAETIPLDLSETPKALRFVRIYDRLRVVLTALDFGTTDLQAGGVDLRPQTLVDFDALIDAMKEDKPEALQLLADWERKLGLDRVEAAN